MKKRTKVVVLSIALCMIIALGVFCVYALTNFTLQSGGSIKFIAPGIDATISNATLTGVSKKTGSGTMSSFSITPSMTTEQIEALDGYKSWSGIQLLFDDESDGKASLSFTITNTSKNSNVNIMVELSTNTTTSSPIQATPSADFCIVPGASHTFTVGLNVLDLANSSKLSDFMLTVDLRIIKPSEVMSQAEHLQTTGLEFTTNSTTHTAIFKKYTTPTAGDSLEIEIPAVIKDAKNNLFTVTEINGGDGSNYSPFCLVSSTISSSIKFPTTLTKIGGYSFYYCNKLTGSLTIPNSVVSIGKAAFHGCSRFTGGLTLGNNLTTIGDYAFENCYGLNGSLIIGNNVTTIGKSAFSGCSKLTNSLIIPDSVTSIGNAAFFGCSNLTGNLKISNNITTIGGSAFYKCTRLTGSLIIPDKVTSIGGSAFAQCEKLTGNLEIPNAVTSIGDSAFYACDGLTGSLIIGSGVSSIEARAFANNNFNMVSVDSGNETYYSKNNCVIAKQDKILMFGTNNSNCTIPQGEGILEIAEYAFYDCFEMIGSLAIPDSVTSIGDYAFYDCLHLTGDLKIPDSVTIIGANAFDNCYNLKGSLIIGNSVTTIGRSAFYGCRGLTGGLVIPDSVISIGDYAIAYCRSLTGSVTIGGNVTNIGNYAFSNSGFSSITINREVPPTLGGTSSFTGTGGAIYVPAGSVETYKTATNWSEYASRIQAIPGQTTIPEDAIIIDETTGEIKNSAETKYTNVKYTILSEADKTVYASQASVDVSGEVEIVDKVYIGGEEYTVTAIADYAFANNKNITSIVIPDTVTQIKMCAFDTCTNLASVVLGRGVTRLGYSAFYGCTKLSSITIPEGLVTIDDEVFGRCTSLKSITLPSTIEEIGSWSFAECSSLTITVKRESPPIVLSDSFKDTTIVVIYVPAASVETYKTATNWKTYASKIQAIPA